MHTYSNQSTNSAGTLVRSPDEDLARLAAELLIPEGDKDKTSERGTEQSPGRRPVYRARLRLYRTRVRRQQLKRSGKGSAQDLIRFH